ncbi:MAG: 3-oxoacyl-[acyl-carrier-protein] reductase [bacterium]|nr:3-oxoacyl-[acyl-carrier-protein] reductase [bacterium]
MFRSDGKIALVTGAAQGIGATIARRLAEHGARVILADISVEKIASVADEIRAAGGEALPIELDVAQSAQVEARLGELPEDWAPVQILVNNAGITRDQLIRRMSPEDWEAVLRINLTGSYTVTRQLVGGMVRQRWGRILFISSVVAMMGNTGQANYAASKAGLIGLAKSLARELGGRNITVNAIAPGFIETPMTDKLGERARQRLSDAVVLGRFGTADDVAAAAVYLASEAAAYVTGQVLNVSGGLYI